MSYEKQTWITGDVITAEKLNHMEDGINVAGGGGGASGILAVHTVNFGQYLDKTWNEIHSVIASGGVCFVYDEFEDEISGTGVSISMITRCLIDVDGKYVVATGDATFKSSDPDGTLEYEII